MSRHSLKSEGGFNLFLIFVMYNGSSLIMNNESIKELAEGFKKLEISLAELKFEAKFRLLKLQYNEEIKETASE